MTGWLSRTTAPLSALTLASFADMGLQVDLSKADPFVLPSLRTFRRLDDENEDTPRLRGSLSDQEKNEDKIKDKIKDKMAYGHDIYTPANMLVTHQDGTSVSVPTGKVHKEIKCYRKPAGCTD
jgi:hypothetical protein